MLNRIIAPLLTIILAVAAEFCLATPGPIILSGSGPGPKTIEDHAMATSQVITDSLDYAANTIDITLAGKKYTKKANESSLTVSQYLTSIEGGIVKTSTDFGLNLRLPNLERRWQLRFTSYDVEEENRDVSQQRVRTRPRPREYGASLLFFEKLGNVKTTFQPRLQLKDPLDMSYVLRFESTAVHKGVRLLPRLDLFADARKGTGEFVSLDLLLELSKHSDLTFQNTEEYKNLENSFTTQHGISYDYSLTDQKALGASYTVVSANHNFHLASSTAALIFTEQIYRRLLKYSLTPFLAFGKSEHFKGKAGITLNIDVVF